MSSVLRIRVGVSARYCELGTAHREVVGGVSARLRDPSLSARCRE